MPKILIVVTSTDEYENAGYRTGLWLGELTHFWDVCEEAGIRMDIASPLGGKVPIDPESLLMTELGESLGIKSAVAKRYEDRGFMNLLASVKPLSEVNPANYEGIYLTGGHGVMFDFDDPILSGLITAFYKTNKIVAAVCHGPCGLLNAKLESGEYVIKGKKVTGFSWQEEILAKRDKAVPYSLEDQLTNRGAEYSKGLAPFTTHLVEDDNLITGQNPNSARAVAEAVARKLNMLTESTPTPEIILRTSGPAMA